MSCQGISMAVARESDDSDLLWSFWSFGRGYEPCLDSDAPFPCKRQGPTTHVRTRRKAGHPNPRGGKVYDPCYSSRTAHDQPAYRRREPHRDRVQGVKKDNDGNAGRGSDALAVLGPWEYG